MGSEMTDAPYIQTLNKQANLSENETPPRRCWKCAESPRA